MICKSYRTVDNMAAPSENEWELSKENVIPIKRGRSVKGLQESLLKPHHGEDTDSAREQVFQEELKLNKDSPIAQLDTYIKYFKWTRDRFPTNSDKALKLLEVSPANHKLKIGTFNQAIYFTYFSNALVTLKITIC